LSELKTGDLKVDIQRNGKTIHIKADEKNNGIVVERKGNTTEVSIDGEKQVFKGNEKIIIDAGGGNDNIQVSNLASGKSGAPLVTIIGGEGNDNFEIAGNVKVIDNKGTNQVIEGNKNSDISTKEAVVNGYVNEIENVLSRKKPNLEVKDKEQILDILDHSLCDGSLNDLAQKLDKDNKLVPLYRAMGTLVNQGELGAGFSAGLMLFTAFTSLVVEANETRANDMKEMLIKGNVPEAILKKLH
jgi:hypothetical protein